MKYTRDEFVSLALRRGAEKRSRRACRRLSGTVGVLLTALVLVICALPGGTGAAMQCSVYGAVLLSAEAGGVVLAAVVAFLLGVAVTLLCVKRKNANKTPPKGEKKEEKQ